MQADLIATRALLQEGALTAAQAMEASERLAQAPAAAHCFLSSSFEQERDRLQRTETAHQPLAGLAISVKDLFDVAGQVTAAGSLALQNAPAAASDAPAVARLRAAGGSIVGRTHMVEFAFSGVGTNPHFTTPAAFDARFGAIPGGARVPGGSSSGAAVSVASGACFAALGSDTGGSIRIPAAFNGLVGFKSTARLVPTGGAIPLSTTLDTACAMTRSVRDAILVHEVLAARHAVRSAAPLSQWRLAVPATTFLEDLAPEVRTAFQRSLDALQQAGAHIETIDLRETAELGPMQAQGSLAAAESYAWHRPLLAQSAHRYDPRVRSRIERGGTMGAADYIDLQHARQDWINRMQARMASFDALLSPCTPIPAPLMADVAPGEARDEAFFKANALVLRNTSVVNMLDGCALSLPCHVRGELPTGLMVWHAGEHDDAVLDIGLRIEELLQK
ncbi:amidase/aspartyl-tRNA(Asn)/glutamyl-tRNA(Gln) amidotransferase subunit A [Acidovorax sp. 62]|uniref:amidase n=1 Tax=Acidovorax sp. 62 TaxID=2035203 RepID=UPI000C19F0A2|nr:amidase [Acidovorax sp. 62]PIF91404.1 amidase/aspartyl-tRNA(Asn)/glutamyl-tRNA(Gln) amidotransferase subunit A [Acidovorax sp. 62]